MTDVDRLASVMEDIQKACPPTQNWDETWWQDLFWLAEQGVSYVGKGNLNKPVPNELPSKPHITLLRPSPEETHSPGNGQSDEPSGSEPRVLTQSVRSAEETVVLKLPEWWDGRSPAQVQQVLQAFEIDNAPLFAPKQLDIPRTVQRFAGYWRLDLDITPELVWLPETRWQGHPQFCIAVDFALWQHFDTLKAHFSQWFKKEQYQWRQVYIHQEGVFRTKDGQPVHLQSSESLYIVSACVDSHWYPYPDKSENPFLKTINTLAKQRAVAIIQLLSGYLWQTISALGECCQAWVTKLQPGAQGNKFEKIEAANGTAGCHRMCCRYQY